jgi:hypothetical protein
MAETTDDGAALASVRLVGVAQSATLVAGTTFECAALASFRLFDVGSDSHCGGGTTCEGASLASVRLLGVGSSSQCGGRHNRCGRFSGLCSIVRRGLSQQLWWLHEM